MSKQRSAFTGNGERGIALLAVMFTLVLLSVIGLGMMYSTNMESAINSNYRDKQVSYYAALAGLQEAKDRIKYPYSITPPYGLPSTTLDNVIYIVSDASVVKPWLPGNRYFDTELCQERTLGMTGTPGVPCTGDDIPAGSAWYQVFDNSDTSAGPWKLDYPLDWKWTRIQLKANNSTPVSVDGDDTNSEQACWSGTTQMSTPNGYTSGCQVVGGVTSVFVENGGTGYSAAPVVAFSGGGGGTGATATAVLAPSMTGYVSAVAIDNGGTGYVTPPAVAFSSGDATATAVLSSTPSGSYTTGIVTGVNLTNPGSGFLTPPTVTLSGGGGSGATAVATLSTTGFEVTTSYVNELTLTNPGSLYTTAPTVALVGGGTGTGATATASLASAGSVKTIALTNAGTQCFSQASDAVVSFVGGGGSGATASAVLEGSKSCIFSVATTSTPHCSARLYSGNGYSPQDQKSGVTFARSGQNESFSGTLYVSTANDKAPVSMTVDNPGYDPSGYSESTFTSQLKLSGGAWDHCGNITVTATTGYRIASLNLTNGGTGFTSTPTVSIVGGVGSTSNPSGTATLGFPVGSLTVTNGGDSYNAPPSVHFSGGGGSGAAATASIVVNSTTTYPLDSIAVTSGGSNYTSAPTVTITGGGGTGAAATATVATNTVNTYPVASVVVNAGGTGYSMATPPAVTFSGGGGTGAAGTATVALMSTGSFMVDHIDVSNAGSGYRSNPTVTLTGGGGSGATARAQVSGGTKYGKVWLLTSLAETRTGARTMLQAEVASPPMGLIKGGALTLDGPNPIIDAMPNSINFYTRGNDANSCAETPEDDVPAITAYDDPNANPPTASVETIIDALPRPDHYVGAGDTPSVQNGYSSLGEMGTPAGMETLIAAIYNAPGSVHYDASNSGTFNPAATTNSSITYVDGNLSLMGGGTGRGILVVTGTLTMSGNFTWYGMIFVVGDGHVEMNGGGTGAIIGSIWVAKIWDNNTDKNLLGSMGSPTFNWNGGGINSVQYDHCYVTNLLTAIALEDLVSPRPLKILSSRILPY